MVLVIFCQRSWDLWYDFNDIHHPTLLFTLQKEHFYWQSLNGFPQTGLTPVPPWISLVEICIFCWKEIGIEEHLCESKQSDGWNSRWWGIQAPNQRAIASLRKKNDLSGIRSVLAALEDVRQWACIVEIPHFRISTAIPDSHYALNEQVDMSKWAPSFATEHRDLPFQVFEEVIGRDNWEYWDIFSQYILA